MSVGLIAEGKLLNYFLKTFGRHCL